MPTKSQVQADETSALLRARSKFLWIVTKEESRVEGYLVEACAAANYVPQTWDCAQGVCDLAGRVISDTPELTDALNTMRIAAERGNTRTAWIMRDLHVWLQGPVGVQTSRQIRNLCRYPAPRDRAQPIIVISPSAEIPIELQGHTTVIDWPLPDREEIAAILDAAITNAVEGTKDSDRPLTIETIINGSRDRAIDAAIGLSGDEAAACYRRSLVQLRRVDPVMVAAEKKRTIAKERVLEIVEPLKGGLDSVGGLDVLKKWLLARAAAYSPRARAYGVPASKGVLLVGLPGGGKSLTAKAIAEALGVPLIKLDFGALMSKFVGDSQGNLRKAFKVIEAMGRCVVWVDEIEKSLAGATDGASDGGVSADQLGSFLSWMQDRQGEAFVVATANSVEKLPPELLRKGRFDELFFVDLPGRTEREQIVAAALRANGRGKVKIDLKAVAKATAGFVGAEIASLVPEALYAAFADGEREIATNDLLAAASNVVPLSKTSAERIAKLREWSVGRARLASTPETVEAPAVAGDLDL